MYKLLLASLSLSTFLNVGQIFAAEPLKIGVLATLKGKYTVLGEDALRGVKTAVAQFDGKVSGREIELVIAPTDTTPKSALKAVRDLVEKQQVEIVIGPLSSDEGIAIRDYSKTKPQVTFLNGVSGAPQITNLNPSETFFRFTTDNSQWSAGLGEYVFNEKAYKRISIVAHDYAFNHSQIFGFVSEYCSSGGEVESRHWLPLGSKDFTSIIENISPNIDAFYLGLSGAEALKFIDEYKKFGGKAKPIGSSITVDGALLNAGDAIKAELIGMPSSGPQADTWGDYNWQNYVKLYQASSPPDQRFKRPSILATGYYNSTTAALTCLNKNNADLTDNHKAFRQCLSEVELTLPTGLVKLDINRQAIANNFVTEVVEQDDGSLVKKLVRIKQNVTQTLGLSNKEFAALGAPTKDNLACVNSN